MINSNSKNTDYSIRLLFSSTVCPAMDFKLSKIELDNLLEVLQAKRYSLETPAFYEITGQIGGTAQIIGIDPTMVTHYIITEIPTILIPKKIIQTNLN